MAGLRGGGGRKLGGDRGWEWADTGRVGGGGEDTDLGARKQGTGSGEKGMCRVF